MRLVKTSPKREPSCNVSSKAIYALLADSHQSAVEMLRQGAGLNVLGDNFAVDFFFLRIQPTSFKPFIKMVRKCQVTMSSGPYPPPPCQPRLSGPGVLDAHALTSTTLARWLASLNPWSPASSESHGYDQARCTFFLLGKAVHRRPVSYFIWLSSRTR